MNRLSPGNSPARPANEVPVNTPYSHSSPTRGRTRPPPPPLDPQAAQTLPKPRPISTYPQEYTAASAADTSEDYSEASESETETETDAESTSAASASAASRHPYYAQWKQYYTAMALYQTLKNQNQNQKPNPNPNLAAHSQRPASSQRYLMYPGMAPSAPANNSRHASGELYLDYYNNSKRDQSTNNFLQKLRRSTLLLQRSSSVPSLDPGRENRLLSGHRAISVNVMENGGDRRSFYAAENGGSLSNFASSNLLVSSSNAGGLSLAKPILHGLSLLALEDLQNARVDASAAPYNTSHAPQNGVNKSGEKDNEQGDDISDYEAFLFDEDSGESSYEDEIGDETAQDIKGEEPALAAPSNIDINRQTSSASAYSYNSLHSEEKFSVSNSKRVVTPASKKRHQVHSFVPPMPGPPPPLLSATPYSPSMAPAQQNPSDDFRRQSTGNLQVDALYLQQMQQMQQKMQQMQQFHQMRQMHRMLQMYQIPQHQLQTQSTPQWSSDATINSRIGEFIDLRQRIAAGSKSMEYRMQWLNMLIVAVNYRLYTYINIKGEAIAKDNIAANKHFFVKSVGSHAQKLLKDLHGHAGNQKTIAESNYIQGCLFMHFFVDKYEQDFGYPLDLDQARFHLEKCLELHPGIFKARYALGKLHDRAQTEEGFDLALEQYKESAQMGYNPAIYQVALALLRVPKVRLVKFIRHLISLSEIDMQSKDIQLSGVDRDELEEVVGLASFQLGRLHEGIYPGDLLADDEFVKQCLELIPVKYARSLGCYNRAAKHHCLDAQVKLGLVYERGELNRELNVSKSIQWFIKASTSPVKFKRSPEAMLGLCRWYLRGSDGVSKHIPVPDPQSALIWCERACKEFQYPEAFHFMGILAQDGLAQGFPEEWFAQARNLGYQPPATEPIENSAANWEHAETPLV